MYLAFHPGHRLNTVLCIWRCLKKKSSRRQSKRLLHAPLVSRKDGPLSRNYWKQAMQQGQRNGDKGKDLHKCGGDARSSTKVLCHCHPELDGGEKI